MAEGQGDTPPPKYAEKDANGKMSEEKSSEAEREGLMAPEVAFKAADAAADAPEDHGPPDRLNIVYIILLIHGIGTLMPWNMFINATKYFEDYKLAPKNANDTTMTLYQSYFLNYLGIVAQVPNVLLNAVNLFCQCRALRGSVSKRIVWSIIVVVICFIFTVVLAMLDSSEWQEAFFWITMVTVVFINMANGVYQNSVYGTAACLPMKYTNAVVLGSNTSGTITAVINILAIAATPNPRSSAIYYFLTAIFILIVAFDTYFALPLFPFYRFHQEKANQHQIKADDELEGGMPPFLDVFKKCWKQHLGVWCVFFVTLSCFPAIQAGIQPVNENFFIGDRYFTAVTCFLFFNAFAMFGNLCTEWVRVPGPRWVWIPIVLRLLFIPFFMFCNYKPDVRGLPVLISNDWVYIVGGILMAFSSGYFSSLTMMYAPRCVEPQHQGIAGMMAAFFLITGIFSGILFSFPLTLILQRVGT